VGCLTMNYKELLNKLIKESGLSNKEIVAKCEKYGEKITPNYLSVLKNQDDKIPSDNLSIALAKACNARYEDILLIQGYLDRAPKVIIDFLEMIMQQSLCSTLAVLEIAAENTPKQLLGDLQRQYDEIKDNYYLALFICEARELKLPYDMKDLINKKSIPEKKWALIPITDPEGIKILSKDEVEATLK
jgi:hypothetical protein